MIEETQEVKGKPTDPSSLPPTAKRIASAVRSYRQIEILHWILDVVFNEDQSRVRKENAGEKMNCKNALG